MREIENAEVRALGRMGSGMDLARIWNGLLQLCNDQPDGSGISRGQATSGSEFVGRARLTSSLSHSIMLIVTVA